MKNNYFLGNIVEKKRIITLLTLLLLIISVGYRFFFIETFARSWDAVDFALALDEFDLIEMQPHFPGYPYFIVGGMFFYQWIDDPIRALTIFNLTMFMLSSIPIYLIAREKFIVNYSLFIVLLVQSIGYISMLSVQPMSEIAAISVMWWYIWSLIIASKTNHLWIKILPGFLFSLILGIRLSYLVFGAGILWQWLNEVKRHGKKHIIMMMITAVLFQLIWIIGLIASIGGLKSFWSISIGFVEGHFSSWGGAVSATETSVIDRFYLAIVNNIFWEGFANESIFAMVLIFILFGLFILNIKHLPKKYYFILVLSGCYLLWAIFAQNIDKPRHIAPLLCLGLFLIASVILSKSGKHLAVIMLLLCFLFVQLYNGYQLGNKAVRQQPATYQMIHYLNKLDSDLVIYTWEETRIMDYLDVSFNHKRIWTIENFKRDLLFIGNQRVFITNHVLKGFKKQGQNELQGGRLIPIKTFHSPKIIDPVYHTITLYEWIPTK